MSGRSYPARVRVVDYVKEADRRELRRQEKLAAKKRLSPLNLATSAAYAACIAAGGHRKSGEVVLRDFLAIPLCSSCGVPILLRRSWNTPL